MCSLGKCRKLRAVFYGPYKVIRWRGPATLQLDLPRNVWPKKAGDALFPVSRVKPYVEHDLTTRQAKKWGMIKIPDKGAFEVGRQYKVRHILGHRGTPGKLRGKGRAEYLVNWHGFDAEDQQFVPESELIRTADRRLRKYLEECKRRGTLDGSLPDHGIIDLQDASASSGSSDSDAESDMEPEPEPQGPA